MGNYQKNFLLFIIIPLVTLFCGCSNREVNLYKNLSKDDPDHLKYKGSYKVGEKYYVNKKQYTPKTVNNYSEVGMASWYGKKFHNKKTANGEIYNKNCLTAAHRTLPMPSLVKVENLKNNKSVILLVNDRGPYSNNRLIDVSEKAATILGFKSAGVAKVKIHYLPDETKYFLKKIGVAPTEKVKIADNRYLGKCSVNCQIKLINMKYNLPYEFNNI